MNPPNINVVSEDIVADLDGNRYYVRRLTVKTWEATTLENNRTLVGQGECLVSAIVDVYRQIKPVSPLGLAEGHIDITDTLSKALEEMRHS